MRVMHVDLWSWSALALASYLLGAIPFGLLIGFARGVDIRTVGSKNIGATNVLRSVGKPWGILTFFLDALKGLVPAAVFPMLGNRLGADFQSLEIAGLAGAVCAILGHNFPIYLGFKGGKGVATSAGAVLGLAPLAIVIGLGVWALVFYSLRYVSLASIVGALAAVAAGWVLYRGQGLVLPVAMTVLGGLVIARHHANIKRLLNGTESRFEKKK
jgi:glycerol-3-phosphate acyltransferase PlsY